LFERSFQGGGCCVVEDESALHADEVVVVFADGLCELEARDAVGCGDAAEDAGFDEG
jgi:hypothetical protein